MPFLCERFGDYLGDFPVAWDWGRLINEGTSWRACGRRLPPRTKTFTMMNCDELTDFLSLLKRI